MPTHKKSIFIRKLIKHFFTVFHFFLRDFKNCSWIWFTYIKHTCIQRKYEPKVPFFKNFKDKAEFTQICYNSELKLSDESYDLLFFDWAKRITLIPLLFFQRFPNKNDNYNFSSQDSYFSKISKLRVASIKSSTYFEGINFNNVIFEYVSLEKVCFHNCVFRNCEFIEINSYISQNLTTVPELTQGFSACEFYNCYFKKCNLENIFFSIGSLTHTTFDNMSFCKCIFHRISFNHVEFVGKTILNQTSIFSPSHNFNIIFRGAVEDFNIDSRCKITAFSYYDIINFSSIRQLKMYKIWKHSIYEEVANTYYSIDQIWASNHIREEDKHIANFYYQRKKAETRSKKGISAIPYLLLESTIGYGEKPFRTFISIALLVFLFSIIYMFTGFTPNSSKPPINYFFSYNLSTHYQILYDWFQSLFFSFFTLITVGQGSASPSSIATQIAMSIELLCGSILMTMFTATLFRKYTK